MPERNFFGRITQPIRNLGQNWRNHPIQSGISTGLSLINPALGAAARFGFNRYNNRGPGDIDPTRMDLPQGQYGIDPGNTMPGYVNNTGYIPGINGPNFGFNYGNAPGNPTLGPNLSPGNNPNPNQQQMQTGWAELMQGIQQPVLMPGSPFGGRRDSRSGSSAGSKTWLEGQAAQDYVAGMQQGGLLRDADSRLALMKRGNIRQ
jgi:hypothetical protein